MQDRRGGGDLSGTRQASKSGRTLQERRSAAPPVSQRVPSSDSWSTLRRHPLKRLQRWKLFSFFLIAISDKDSQIVVFVRSGSVTLWRGYERDWPERLLAVGDGGGGNLSLNESKQRTGSGSVKK